MKSLKWIIISAAFGFVIASCEKGTELQEVLVDDLTEEIVVEGESSDSDDDEIMAIVIDGDQFGPSDCPEVTHSADPGTFPQTITIDYGDECEDRHGRIKSGLIVIEISGPLLLSRDLLKPSRMKITL